MEEIAVVRVDWGMDLQKGIGRCMRLYGYGYEYLAVVNEDAGYAYLAESYIRIESQEVLEIIDDYYEYYEEFSTTNRLLDDDGKRLVLKNL